MTMLMHSMPNLYYMLKGTKHQIQILRLLMNMCGPLLTD